MKNLENFNLTLGIQDLNNQEIVAIQGGDNITQAVFEFLGTLSKGVSSWRECSQGGVR